MNHVQIHQIEFLINGKIILVKIGLIELYEKAMFSRILPIDLIDQKVVIGIVNQVFD